MRVCIRIPQVRECVRRGSSENRQGHKGDGGNEGRGGGEIKEVTGETVDGKQGAGRGEERGQEETRGARVESSAPPERPCRASWPTARLKARLVWRNPTLDSS
ncbi:hypothetical protein Q5P01_005744 [Channa striata]|uniref:Uncharacterized protein n=1 Tax=Channa striata TaxID=64152 RepID=A0AA88NDA1_CHASR|nr:hypothetical protein Q5P01_005744 [Channa striata]